MMASDLLDMKLSKVSDLLLQEMCERQSRECIVRLPGTEVRDGERVVLTVRLEYETD